MGWRSGSSPPCPRPPIARDDLPRSKLLSLRVILGLKSAGSPSPLAPPTPPGTRLCWSPPLSPCGLTGWPQPLPPQCSFGLALVPYRFVLAPLTGLSPTNKKEPTTSVAILGQAKELPYNRFFSPSATSHKMKRHHLHFRWIPASMSRSILVGSLNVA